MVISTSLLASCFVALTACVSAQSLLIRDARIVDPVDKVVRTGSVMIRNGV